MIAFSFSTCSRGTCWPQMIHRSSCFGFLPASRANTLGRSTLNRAQRVSLHGWGGGYVDMRGRGGGGRGGRSGAGAAVALATQYPVMKLGPRTTNLGRQHSDVGALERPVGRTRSPVARWPWPLQELRKCTMKQERKL